MASIKFLNTGAIQTYTVPAGLNGLRIKVWGAAGGPHAGLNSYAGCGGYSQGDVVVTPGQVLQIMVGSVGIMSSAVAYGGGGAGGADPSSGSSAQGGGRSGVSFSTTLPQFIIAGGGGGAGQGSGSSLNLGGNGGGLSGNDESIITGGAVLTPAKGGTQTAGGAGGINAGTGGTNGFAGSSLQGGKGGNGAGGGAGGGGGGGYFGGGGGTGTALYDPQGEQAGAGGSSYLDPILTNAFTLVTPQTIVGGIVYPPKTSDPDYIAGIGVANGATGTGKGLVVLTGPELVLTKTVDKTFAASGNVLNYTVAIKNMGPGTLNNINFLDTIPAATTFVSNSLKQDGIAISGSPASPGVTLPNSLAENQVTTVTFSVNVTGSSPNVVTNQAMSSYLNGTFQFSSNIVTTTISNVAILTSTKTASTTFAAIGDTITYNIVTQNTGSVTASNVVLIDTIPNGTTFIADSIYVNGINQLGSTVAPPTGLTIPDIGYTSFATISFKVIVTSIPSPNPIPNSGNIGYSYIINPVSGTTGSGSSNTNIVTTQINTALIQNPIKYVDKTYANIADTITYSIVLTNTGNTTATNIVLIDTIPNGTTFIASSFKQDGTTVSGSPTPPGANLPNSIGIGATSTIVFSVVVNTIPNPNPIPNNATESYSFIINPVSGTTGSGRGSTNTVNTTINNANLGNISKSVNLKYVTCGDILTYIITIPNNGNVTATNVIFKDTIPTGTNLLTNTILVNGVSQPIGTNPQTGINVGSIGPNSTATVSFQVSVNC